MSEALLCEWSNRRKNGSQPQGLGGQSHASCKRGKQLSSSLLYSLLPLPLPSLSVSAVDDIDVVGGDDDIDVVGGDDDVDVVNGGFDVDDDVVDGGDVGVDVVDDDGNDDGDGDDDNPRFTQRPRIRPSNERE